MSFPIHEKIQLQLSLRKRRKKDLAASLGIAPQTMTDICKGRSAVTLMHLKGLIRFFDLRASYWLDDTRREPDPLDRVDLFDDADLRRLEAVLLAEHPPETAAHELSAILRTRESALRAAGIESPHGLHLILEVGRTIPKPSAGQPRVATSDSSASDAVSSDAEASLGN